MPRISSLLVLSALSLGLSLGTPAVSHAQTPFGIQLGVGNAQFSYQQGYPYYSVPYVVNPPVVVAPRPVPVLPYGHAPLYPRHHHRPYYSPYWGGSGYYYGGYRPPVLVPHNGHYDLIR